MFCVNSRRDCNVSCVCVSKWQKAIMNTSEFETLAATLRPGLLRVAASVLSDASAQEAEDVVQDTLLKLWTMRDALADYRSVEALAVTVARHLALNVLRSSSRTVGLSPDAAENFRATELSAEQRLIAADELRHLDCVLAALPESLRALIELRHVRGMSTADIAAMLGSTEGAVRTALCRARRRVAEVFGVGHT